MVVSPCDLMAADAGRIIVKPSLRANTEAILASQGAERRKLDSADSGHMLILVYGLSPVIHKKVP